MEKLLVAVLFAMATTAPQRQGPVATGVSSVMALTVVFATKDEVRLRWASESETGDYTVERRPLGATAYTVVARVSTLEARDMSFDPNTVYGYRVRSTKAGSAPTNEVTVGPPPAGFSVAAVAPVNREASFGHLSLSLDANGDPMVAFVQSDPDANANPNDSLLKLLTWDRANYRWNEPQLVDVVGAIDSEDGQLQVSLTKDPASDAIAVAYQKVTANGAREIWLAAAKYAGGPWVARRIQQAAADKLVSNPAAAMRGGQAHLVFFQEEVGFVYATGKPAEGKFTLVPAPELKGKAAVLFDYRASLALDAGGRPAIAFLRADEGDPDDLPVYYWRPGDAAATLLTRPISVPNEVAGLALAFAGTKPRLALLLQRTDEEAKNLWLLSADESGKWSDPLSLPSAAGERWDVFPSLAIAQNGYVAVIAPIIQESGKYEHGKPRLVRSTDMKQWKLLTPDSGTDKAIETASNTAAVFGTNSKLFVAFTHVARFNPKLAAGVVIWREP